MRLAGVPAPAVGATRASGVELGWCATHVRDDGLPPLEPDRLGYCIRCDEMCVTWLGDVPVHRWCQRLWTAGTSLTARPGLGAYGRRRG